MTINTPKFTRQKHQTTSEVAKIGDLITDAAAYSFRSPGDLKDDEKSIMSLAESIASAGRLHNPLLVQEQPNGKFLVVDGHRRHAALRLLAKDGRAGFTEDKEVPCLVLPQAADELELLLSGGESNNMRESLVPEERAKWAVRVQELGADKPTIARTLGVSEKTIDRDIRIGRCDWLLEHVTAGDIRYSTATSLIDAAAEHGREDDLKEWFENDWLKKTEKAIRKKNEERIDQGKNAMSAKERRPERYLKKEQVKAWIDCLKQVSGEPVNAEFRPLMLVGKDDQGITQIEIGSLKKPVPSMSKQDLARLSKSAFDFAEGVMQEAVRMEDVVETSTTSPGEERLRAAGLGAFLDEPADDDGESDEEGFYGTDVSNESFDSENEEVVDE